MFRMSKASIIRSSICTEQVGRYNARTNTQHTTPYDDPTITRTLYLPTCSLHIELLMMDAFDIRNMQSLLRCNKTSAELYHAGFIYYNLHDARNHENQIDKKKILRHPPSRHISYCLIRLSSYEYHRNQQRRRFLDSGLAVRFTVFLSRCNFIRAVTANPLLRTQNTRVCCRQSRPSDQGMQQWTSVVPYHSNNGEVWAGYCHVAFQRPDRCKNRMYGGLLFRIRSRSVTGLYCSETSPNNCVPVVDSEHM